MGVVVQRRLSATQCRKDDGTEEYDSDDEEGVSKGLTALLRRR